jgi:hypothetical protein
VTRREPGPDAVRVPRDVMEGLEAVRLSGLTNMLDRPRVAQVAAAMGYDACARWVREHRDLYARGVFRGFEAELGREGLR